MSEQQLDQCFWRCKKAAMLRDLSEARSSEQTHRVARVWFSKSAGDKGAVGR